MIIDTSYFFGPLAIGQISSGAVQSTVQSFINEHEPKFLIDLLGYALYKPFITALGYDPTDFSYANVTEGKADDSVDQRFKDLLNGTEYTTIDGYLQKWEGLTPSIVNYVYYYYLRSTATVSTGSGEKINATENATEASPKFKMVKAWNNMVQRNTELKKFLVAKATTYPEFMMVDYDQLVKRDYLLTNLNPIF